MMRRVGQALLVVGILASIPSMFATFSHVADPAYRLSDFQRGEAADPVRSETHASYHAFREFLLAGAALAVIAVIAFSPRMAQDPLYWRLSLILGAGYTLGWWLPWPLFGLRAPHAVAEAVHGIATLCIVAGVALARPVASSPTRRPM